MRKDAIKAAVAAAGRALAAIVTWTAAGGVTTALLGETARGGSPWLPAAAAVAWAGASVALVRILEGGD